MTRKRQPAEPYRIKSVEPIRLLNRDERLKRIAAANYNIFKLDAADIYIDLLTDSGTCAMSARQWAALMMGDETYAGAVSFRKFEKTVRSIFRKKFVIPCHQGRSAENLMFTSILEKGKYVINNTHFDTTRGNTLHKGGVPVDLPCPEANLDEPAPFKGNMDTLQLEEFIHRHGAEKIAMVIMTITNNSVGGQPVSLSNIKEVSEICRRHHLLFYFDCARFAENAFFIKRDEPGYEDKSIREIASEMFDACDGMMMSAKKDGLANIGGFIALNDEALYRRLTELMILVEGFPTYGGLAGRDLEVLAVGLEEVMDYDYLDFRIDQVAYFGEKIKQAGIPIVEPTGGHAVFCDAGKLLGHIPPHQFPGQSMTVEFYIEGGVRVVEMGSIMFGGTDPNTGEKLTATKELVRMALPRRVYTNSHLDYIAEVAEKVVAKKESLAGYRIVRQPVFLRHFTCDLESLKPEGITVDSQRR
ncbi:MAG: tryptophanase [candidate division Zixibacteria bacterium]|nr:tryptophanase [candidate division Zixibacteria bacterium]